MASLCRILVEEGRELGTGTQTDGGGVRRSKTVTQSTGGPTVRNTQHWSYKSLFQSLPTPIPLNRNPKHETNIRRLIIGRIDSQTYLRNTFRTKHTAFNKHPPHFQLILYCPCLFKTNISKHSYNQ